MSKVGIYWTKGNDDELDYEREPPYPSFNAMGVVVDTFTSAYVNQCMASAFWERYQRASKEICEMHKKLSNENKELIKRVNELETEIRKWKEQQGKGRSRNESVYAQIENVWNWSESGISGREIARRLGISEGTVRRMLKMRK